MTAHEVVIRRAVQWVAVTLLALNLPLSAQALAKRPGYYRTWTGHAVLAVLAILALVALAQCLRRASAHVPLAAVVVTSYLTLLVHPLLVASYTDAYPPLFHALGAGMSLTPVFGARVAAGLVPVFAVQVALIRSPAIGTQRAVIEAVLLALTGFITTGCVDVLDRANRSVVNAARTTWALRERASLVARRSAERARWDALVHDKVLGALRIAWTAVDEVAQATARALALEALAAFHGDASAQESEPADRWQAVARRLGLQARIEVTGSLPDPDVRTALVEAAAEAITNVARHSGQHNVRVHAELSAVGALVVVEDEGVGFDTAPDRWGTGLLVSIGDRVRSVGGDVLVTSAVDEGTRVVLSWRGDQAAPEPTEWQLRTFAPMMILGTAAFVLNVGLGAPQWLHARSVAVSVVAILALVGITAAATLIDPTSRRAVLVPVASALVVVALAANTPHDAPFDWRYWYLGALTPAMGALSFRGRQWVGFATATALPLLVVPFDVRAGRPALTVLAGPVPVLVATAAAGLLLRRALDSAWRHVSLATERDGELRLRIALERERADEAEARVHALASAVVPTLTALVKAPVISDADRTQFRHLEASVRDHLSAPALLDAPLVQVLAESRARGVRVDLVSSGAPVSGSDDAQAAELDQIRMLLTQLLRAAAPMSRVRVTWRPFPGSVSATISLVGAGVVPARAALAAFIADLPPNAYPPTLTGDEDHLLVEISLVAATWSAVPDAPAGPRGPQTLVVPEDPASAITNGRIV